jgi:hypothetical protein
LVPLADRELEVPGLQYAAFIGGQAALLGRARKNAALRVQQAARVEKQDCRKHGRQPQDHATRHGFAAALR